jgi:Rrf2 family protein
MRVNKKTKYGVEVLVHMAKSAKDREVVQGKVVAAKLGINEPHFDQIMMTLRQSGWVKSIRGRRGGYVLSCPASEIMILDVIELFEGPLVLGNSEGSSFTSYAGFGIWRDVATLFREALSQMTLQKVLDQEETLSLDYMI